MSKDVSSKELNDALMSWALRALEAGRHQAALVMTDAAANASPSPDGLNQLAVAQRTCGDPDGAVATLERSLDLFGADAPIGTYYLLGLSQAQLARFDRAVANIRRFREVVPHHAMSAYHLASVLGARGSFEEANALFAGDIAVPCGDGLETSSTVVRFPTAPPAALLTEVQEPPFSRTAKLQHVVSVSDEEIEIVYFVCCDSRYFKLFAEPLAASIVQKSGVCCLLHIHLINPDAGTESLISSLRLIIPNLVISIEQTVLEALPPDRHRTYYACARFFVLPALLRHYGKPVIVADIDQMVVNPLGRFVAEGGRHDIGFIKFSQGNFNILSMISASVLFFNHTSGAERFCAMLSGYLAERMREPRAVSWHLDQAALAVAHLALPELDYFLIPPKTMESVPYGTPPSLDDDVLFWSITFSNPQNQGKLSTPTFERFQRKAEVVD